MTGWISHLPFHVRPPHGFDETLQKRVIYVT